MITFVLKTIDAILLKSTPFSRYYYYLNLLSNNLKLILIKDIFIYWALIRIRFWVKFWCNFKVFVFCFLFFDWSQDYNQLSLSLIICLMRSSENCYKTFRDLEILELYSLNTYWIEKSGFKYWVTNECLNREHVFPKLHIQYTNS
jgi:hypothetical protein